MIFAKKGQFSGWDEPLMGTYEPGLEKPVGCNDFDMGFSGS